jgi:hypothetical protein
MTLTVTEQNNLKALSTKNLKEAYNMGSNMLASVKDSFRPELQARLIFMKELMDSRSK